MIMQNTDWLKLYRGIINSSVFDNPDVLKVFIWILCKANYTKNEAVIGLQSVAVEKGQMVFGRKTAARELKMNESKVYRIVTLLEKVGVISQKANNKFTLISVVKWGDYQGAQQKTNNKRTTNEQQMNNKRTHYKNIRNKERKNIAQAQNSLFETFWNAYPRKMNKEQALDEFNRLGVDDALLQKIISGLNSKIKTPQWQDVNFIPYPKNIF